MRSRGSEASAATDLGSPSYPQTSVPLPPRTPPPPYYENTLRQQEKQATQWPGIFQGLLSGTLFEWDWFLWRTVAGKPGHLHLIGLDFASEGPGGLIAIVAQGTFLGPYRSQKFSLRPNHLNPTPTIPDWSRILAEIQDLALFIPTTEPSSLPLLARTWWHEQQGYRCLLDNSSAAFLRACGRAALALADVAALLRARQQHDDLV